jgi:hypothetical protein
VAGFLVAERIALVVLTNRARPVMRLGVRLLDMLHD